MNKRITSGALAAMMAVTMMPLSACAAAAEDSAPVPSLNTTDHMQYLNGYADGSFRPDGAVTRAEACKMLSTMLMEKSAQSGQSFTDIDASAWYAEAVSQMSAFGLVGGYQNGTFRPDATITRAEFAAILSRLPHNDLGTEKTFSDVPKTHWAFDAVQTAQANGWITGDPNGTFRPDAAITRAETVTVLNRVLGRQADQLMAMSGEGIRIMPDVPDTHWAYYAMLEATTDHDFTAENGAETWTSYDKETTPLAAGWHNIAGELFHVNAAQMFDRNTTIGLLELDRNGRYTTGSTELDTLLTSAAKKAVNDSMTQEQKLRAVYDYAKKTFGYLGIGTVDPTQPWEVERATEMLKTGKGNCYSWASAFTYLARKVGYSATAIAGTGVSPKGSESEHAWTEITIDGTPYTFDPQIESIYASRYGENYDLYMKKYGEAEWGYKANEQQAPETGAPQLDAALNTLLDKIYDGVGYEAALGRVPVTKENMKNLLGTEQFEIEAGVASEAMITSIAHSIVVARFKDGTDMEAAKKAVREGIDPYKWVCVGVEPDKVKVEAVGNTLVLIMDNEFGDKFLANFQAAMK